MKVLRTQEGSETWNTRGVITACEIKYLVIDPPDKESAMRAVLAASPESMGETFRSSIRFDGFDEEKNAEISVVYEVDDSGGSFSNADDEDESATMSFDCGGGTKHLLYSLAQKKVYGDKDAGGAIGWNGKTGSEMEITGVDIPTAQLRETYTRTMKISALTTSYKRNVASLVGKVNSGSFKGWSEGEVMFLGMSYSTPAKDAEKVTVTFNFSIQPNESEVKIGEHTVSKMGFEYVWALSKTTADNENHTPEVRIDGLYKDQVCEYASFSVLGL